jgi:uncharacterized protein YsxB (DUF464 family)
MKKIILGLVLALSSSAFAAKNISVYPSVYNFGYSVQVQIWNTTEKTVSCSGFINMFMDNNQQESQYYSEFVTARFNSIRNIYPRQMNVRVTSVSHSIYCF